MIGSFLTTGLRNIFKNKVYALISVVGLSVSTAAVLFISHIVYTELTHDNFHRNEPKIYRLTFDEAPSGRPGARHFAKASPPAGPELAESFPEIESFVRLRYSDSDVFAYKDKRFYEFGLFYADSTFFDIFSFELSNGDKKTALKLANSIVISPKIAKKYFGEDDAIGKVLRLNEERDFIVTGVLQDIPANSHLTFDILLPFHAFKVPFGYPVDLNSWSWPSFSTYFLMRDDISPTELEKKFIDYSKKNLPEEISGRFAFKLQPLSEVYFGNLRASEIKSGNKNFVISLIIIAIILLLLSSLNFINLNSTRLLIRGKESAMRKVMGASKSDFYKQFVSESFILTFLASATGAAMFYALDDQLQLFFNLRHVSINEMVVYALLMTFVSSLILGLFSGLYPAFVASRLEVIKAAKGEMKTGKSAIRLRSVMISIQFIITSALIGGVVLVYQQLDFIANKELGFDKENILVLDAPGEDITLRGELLRMELAKKPSIVGVAFSGTDLNGNSGNVPIYPEGNEFDEGYPMPIVAAKPGWIELLNLKMLAGHSFSDKLPLDSSEIVINETAAKIFNWQPQDAIDKRIRVSEILEGRVVGVVSDFNYASLRSEISPLVIFIPRTHLNKVFIKFQGNNFSQLIQSIETSWKTVFPSSPFYFRFLDETIQNQYAKEKNFQRMLLSFSIVAMLIACSGIYSFVAFIVKLKNKETALRKVLGSSYLGIYLRLLKPFVINVTVANLIAIPMSTVFINTWLSDFAYRISIDPLVFFWILFSILLLVVITTSAPVVRALRVNPIKFLRDE